MTSPDAGLSIRITELAGKVPFIDNIMTVLASDFFVPVTMSFFLLSIWFGISDSSERKRNQKGVIAAASALGIANLVVWLLNHAFKFNPWPRPFEAHESATHAAQTVFYMPQDPSFPANVAAAGFAAAIGMLFWNRKASIPLFALATLWSFARVWAGVHYPLDILGGLVIGTASAIIYYQIPFFVKSVPERLILAARNLYMA